MVKQIGNFIVWHMSADKVVISYKERSSTVAQLVTNEKLKDVLESSGKYCELFYQGFIYLGIIFYNPYSESELQKILLDCN